MKRCLLCCEKNKISFVDILQHTAVSSSLFCITICTKNRSDAIGPFLFLKFLIRKVGRFINLISSIEIYQITCCHNILCDELKKEIAFFYFHCSYLSRDCWWFVLIPLKCFCCKVSFSCFFHLIYCTINIFCLNRVSFEPVVFVPSNKKPNVFWTIQSLTNNKKILKVDLRVKFLFFFKLTFIGLLVYIFHKEPFLRL